MTNTGAHVSLITGAASGIGAATVERFAKDSRQMVLCDINSEGLAQIAERFDVPASNCVAGDVRDGAFADRVLSSLRGKYVDSAVLAAGVSATMASPDQILHINLGSTIRLVAQITPFFAAESAVIVFGSLATLAVRPDEDTIILSAVRDGNTDYLAELFQDAEAAYAASKRGLQLLARERSWSLRGTGTRVLSITPGVIDSPMGHAAAAAHPSMAALVQRSPAMRMGAPAEIADLIAFLVSPSARFITGTDILIDGGASLALSHA